MKRFLIQILTGILLLLLAGCATSGAYDADRLLQGARLGMSRQAAEKLVEERAELSDWQHINSGGSLETFGCTGDIGGVHTELTFNFVDDKLQMMMLWYLDADEGWYDKLEEQIPVQFPGGEEGPATSDLAGMSREFHWILKDSQVEIYYDGSHVLLIAQKS